MYRGAVLTALCLTACGCGNHRPTTPTSAIKSSPVTQPVITTAQHARDRRPVRARAPFVFASKALPPSIRARVVGVSWREGCPLPLADLRYLRVGHWDFDGRRRVGELIVGADHVGAVREAFGALYRARFPIRRMRLVDDYGADDYASIEADNTSAFNCRQRTGGGGWSEHAYGRAIDLNPLENPYVSADGTTTHPRSRPFLERSSYRAGMARRDGTLVRAFSRAGWGWGGNWAPAKDLQHFSSTGG